MYSYSPVYKEEDDLMFDMEEDEMAKMIGLVDTLKGQSLVLWLTELQVIIIFGSS